MEVSLDLSAAEMMSLARSCGGVLLPGSPADVDPRLYGQMAIPACAPADSAREEADRLLLEEAFAARKPVLGICYGVQSLNVWLGGSLVQDLPYKPVNHSAGAAVSIAHTVCAQAGGALDLLADPSERSQEAGEARIPVNSSHHQAVDRLGAGLRVAAVSSQDGVVEAIECVPDGDGTQFVLGVQWHPERTIETSGTSRAIFRAFLQATSRELDGTRRQF